MSCCNTCVTDTVGCLTAEDVLTLNIGGLTNGEDYLAIVRDAQGNEYAIPFTFDATTNQVELPIGDGDNELPAAIFNKHIGELEIEIHDAETHDCVDFTMLVSTKCISATVNGVTGAYAKDVIGLDIPVGV